MNKMKKMVEGKIIGSPVTKDNPQFNEDGKELFQIGASVYIEVETEVRTVTNIECFFDSLSNTCYNFFYTLMGLMFIVLLGLNEAGLNISGLSVVESKNLKYIFIICFVALFVFIYLLKWFQAEIHYVLDEVISIAICFVIFYFYLDYILKFEIYSTAIGGVIFLSLGLSSHYISKIYGSFDYKKQKKHEINEQ